MGPAPSTYLDRLDREPAETKLKLARQLMADADDARLPLLVGARDKAGDLAQKNHNDK